MPCGTGHWGASSSNHLLIHLNRSSIFTSEQIDIARNALFMREIERGNSFQAILQNLRARGSVDSARRLSTTELWSGSWQYFRVSGDKGGLESSILCHAAAHRIMQQSDRNRLIGHRAHRSGVSGHYNCSKRCCSGLHQKDHRDRLVSVSRIRRQNHAREGGCCQFRSLERGSGIFGRAGVRSYGSM